jgi:enoyl-CoA hydratase/carnithine racemase
MRIRLVLATTIAVCSLFALAAIPSCAQDHGNHSGYMHALTDLRLMRAYLNRWGDNDRVDEESEHAIAEIDEAMRNIREARIDDHKQLNDHREIDFHMSPPERYHKALEAGRAAAEDVGSEGEWGEQPGLKERVHDHVEAANHIVEHIVHRMEDHREER